MPSQITAADLYITGNVTAGGTIQANYSDLAEWFLCDSIVKVGEPVSIVGLRRVGKYNGKGYAGIKSHNPGLTMGGEMKTGILVALIGSVPVLTKDDTINVGDTLILTKKGIIKKKWYHFKYQYIGISQEKYKKDKVICLVGVK